MNLPNEQYEYQNITLEVEALHTEERADLLCSKRPGNLCVLDKRSSLRVSEGVLSELKMLVADRIRHLDHLDGSNLFGYCSNSM